MFIVLDLSSLPLPVKQASFSLLELNILIFFFKNPIEPYEKPTLLATDYRLLVMGIMYPS